VRLGTLAALLLAAWIPTAAAASDGGYPEPRALGEGLPSIAVVPQDATEPAPAAAELTGAITLRDALAAALLHNPTLAVYAWEVRAREARILQAGLRPNPEASFEIEDVGVTGDFAGLDQMQATLRLGQLVELGGKRDARLRASALERDVAGWDYETARLDAFARAAQRFVTVLGAQEVLSVRQESGRIADEVVVTAKARLDAGMAPIVEVTRAQVARSQAELAREAARVELDQARVALAAQWGQSEPRFDRAEGALDIALSLPPPESLLSRLPESPELARWETETESRRAELALQRSQAVPDVTLIGGVRRLFGPDDTTFVGEIAVPLPLWNKNQGRVAEAERRLARAGAERRAAEVSARAAFEESYRSLRGLAEQAHGFRTHVLPGVETTLTQLRQGYEQGRFSQLDVLTAERERVAARVEYVRVLTAFHRGVATLERVVGAPIDAKP
jgi:cobalt-zinc-cadmium efflux system outer membrane protein